MRIPTVPPLHRSLHRWLRLALVAACAPVAARAQGPFTSLTFFGDSYSDTGNAYLLTLGLEPPSPPYATGRFSNGPIWVDYFAQALGRPSGATPAFLTRAASGDYAVASARTTGSLISTQAQIGSYLSRLGTTPGTVTDPTGLYALFAGGDDLRDAGSIADAATRQAAAATAARNVVTQAGLLAASGARDVLLFSLPSLGATPEAQGIAGRPAIDDQLASTFDATLAAGLAGLHHAYGATTFFDFRLDNLFANILHDAANGGSLYGLTNVSTPCLGPPVGPAGAPSCNVSVFADSLHPTTRTDQLIAQAAARYVTTGQNVTPTPEPTAGWLVGIGVLAVAGIAGATDARRRRA
ncbi:MAG TPA: SGNH/GDSL hydrolase family protein [Gemmatirosa sp.]